MKNENDTIVMPRRSWCLLGRRGCGPWLGNYIPIAQPGPFWVPWSLACHWYQKNIFKLFTIYYLPTCLLSIDYVLFTTQLFNWLLEAFFLGGLPYRCGQAITSIGDFEIVMNYWLNPFVFSIVHFLKGFKEFLKPAAIDIFYLLSLLCTDGATLWENEVLLCILKRFFSCIFFVFLVIFLGGACLPQMWASHHI